MLYRPGKRVVCGAAVAVVLYLRRRGRRDRYLVAVRQRRHCRGRFAFDLYSVALTAVRHFVLVLRVLFTVVRPLAVQRFDLQFRCVLRNRQRAFRLADVVVLGKRSGLQRVGKRVRCFAYFRPTSGHIVGGSFAVYESVAAFGDCFIRQRRAVIRLGIRGARQRDRPLRHYQCTVIRGVAVVRICSLNLVVYSSDICNIRHCIGPGLSSINTVLYCRTFRHRRGCTASMRRTIILTAIINRFDGHSRRRDCQRTGSIRYVIVTWDAGNASLIFCCQIILWALADIGYGRCRAERGLDAVLIRFECTCYGVFTIQRVAVIGFTVSFRRNRQRQRVINGNNITTSNYRNRLARIIAVYLQVLLLIGGGRSRRVLRTDRYRSRVIILNLSSCPLQVMVHGDSSRIQLEAHLQHGASVASNRGRPVIILFCIQHILCRISRSLVRIGHGDFRFCQCLARIVAGCRLSRVRTVVTHIVVFDSIRNFNGFPHGIHAVIRNTLVGEHSCGRLGRSSGGGVLVRTIVIS